ncbi:unnamed protein product, partial [Symbiodinium sp. KB8]
MVNMNGGREFRQVPWAEKLVQKKKQQSALGNQKQLRPLRARKGALKVKLTSEPNVTKSGHMRTTSRDESERRDKDKEREGEQNGTQTRRASGITRSRSDLMKSQEARAGRKGCNTEGAKDGRKQRNREDRLGKHRQADDLDGSEWTVKQVKSNCGTT